MSNDKEYLVEYDFDLTIEKGYQTEKYESKGSCRRKFFKVDSEGFIYATYERPSDVDERDDYDE